MIKKLYDPQTTNKTTNINAHKNERKYYICQEEVYYNLQITAYYNLLQQEVRIDWNYLQ